MVESGTHHSLRTRVLLAFLAVYIIWGSTYLAIRIAIETLPPFMMAGVRFCVAGTALLAIAFARGAARPTRRQWRNAAIIGAFLLLGGNGGVVWAEQRVPSGLTAVVIASVPLWMALLEWARGESGRPGRRVALGLFCGMAGVALLVNSKGDAGRHTVDPLGALVLVLGSASWAWGSLVARKADLPRSPFLATAMEMLSGGVLLLLWGAVQGEFTRFDVQAVSLRSVLATGYLVVFGALVAFTAYVYLLGATTPTRVSTYAFVNPLVAVVIGAVFAGERIPPSGLAAALVIVLGVVLIVTVRRPPPAARGLTQDARKPVAGRAAPPAVLAPALAPARGVDSEGATPL